MDLVRELLASRSAPRLSVSSLLDGVRASSGLNLSSDNLKQNTKIVSKGEIFLFSFKMLQLRSSKRFGRDTFGCTKRAASTFTCVIWTRKTLGLFRELSFARETLLQIRTTIQALKRAKRHSPANAASPRVSDEPPGREEKPSGTQGIQRRG